MADRSYRIRVLDIIDEINAVEQIRQGKDFDAYTREVVTRRAIERCVEIISEASRHIPDDVKADYPSVPWHKIRAIGNLLRHEYGRVEDLVIWRIAEASLPDLKPVMTKILAGLPEEVDD